MSESTKWPPSTLNLSANQLFELQTIAVDFVEHLKTVLPEACAKEGHIWDNPEGVYKSEHEGGTWIESDSEVWGRGSGWRGGEIVAYYIRTCTRCGHESKRRGVETTQSPFVNTKDKQ